MAEIVGIVTDKEKEEIRELFEKKTALENLNILNLNETVSIEINKDLVSVQYSMQDWWKNCAEKYKWKGGGSSKHWDIVFSTGEIILV